MRSEMARKKSLRQALTKVAELPHFAAIVIGFKKAADGPAS